MNPSVQISCQFDAGSIEIVDISDPANLQLRIRRDSAADFTQWFYFALHGPAGQPLVFRFMNAGECSYPKGWEGYSVMASHDRQHWFRADTRYEDGVVTVRTTLQSACMYFAYFEPYSWEQHLDLLGAAANSPHVTQERLGASAQGRDLTLLQITDAQSTVPVDDRKKIWIIARQHPGETMAEWCAEGLIERLLDTADSVSRVLLERCVFHVVPNMNPDGAILGNLRTNAVGANLNREWVNPSLERSPEVYWVRQKMLATGVDLFLDLHGDEILPYNFVVGSEGTASYSPRVAELEVIFKQAWLGACPDFQDDVHYPVVEPGKGNPALATNWVAEQFACLAFTVEMPFKDNAKLPDAAVGWSGERSRKLGASLLQPLLALL